MLLSDIVAAEQNLYTKFPPNNSFLLGATGAAGGSRGDFRPFTFVIGARPVHQELICTDCLSRPPRPRASALRPWPLRPRRRPAVSAAPSAPESLAGSSPGPSSAAPSPTVRRPVTIRHPRPATIRRLRLPTIRRRREQPLTRLRQPPITRPRRRRMPNWHRAATGDSAESG